MKSNLFLLKTLLLLLPTLVTSQTAVSITNGNWTNPLTWNCTCVPLMGHSVTINHTVTLNTSMSFTTGGVTINNSGALIQDAALNRDIWVNGGYFLNNGKANFRYFLATTGSANNNGTFTISAFNNAVNFTNTGTIKMDSMYVAGNFTNTAIGKIIGDSLTNASNLTNNGFINIKWVTNNSVFRNNNYQGGYAFTNNGTYDNYDSLMLSGSFWNKKKFNNRVGAKFNMTKNFHNYHPSKTAVFDNNGMVRVLDSWYSTDTVKGSSTGYFIVSDTSANSGFMKGNFGFCDLTPPATAPFVDFNTGSIALGITWCGPLGVQELSINKLNIYPNPNAGYFTIKGFERETIYLIDALGRVFKEYTLNETNDFKAEIIELENGIYFLKGKNYSAKIIVAK